MSVFFVVILSFFVQTTPLPGNGGFRSAEMYSTEFEINETPPSARTLLTKGYVQDDINESSGASVSTRGRFMTESEKRRCPDERPLYLFIQGHTKLNIDLAVQKIEEIIKAEQLSSLNRPSRFTNAPPPLMSLRSGIPSVEKICIGIENAPPGFDLRGRIVGTGGANLLYIRGETGATVTLRGRGSQFVDPGLGTESPEPLHLYIEHKKLEGLQSAKQLGINLIQTMQSELQSFIQQQPPPVHQQQILQAPPIQQIQQAHFQTMNIGALTQSNVVTIQHQDIIQHPQSSVVTLPATILTATMAGAPGAGVTVPPPGVHIPAQAGSLVPSNQTQDMQTFVSPPPVGQVQLIGPPPTVSQVQYQIHSAQPLHIQMPPSSHSSPQPVAQMYVMSQPPPPPPPPQQQQQPNHGQPPFVSNSGDHIGGTVSYVYAQPNVSRPASPSQAPVETLNVNLQQPPPPPPPLPRPASSATPNMTQHPPPSLLHLHFPPPNFPPNHPPPPIPHTYQIQYQQMQPPGPQTPTQFLLQSAEHMVPQPGPQNPENSLAVAQHVVHPHFEGQPHHLSLQVPPPPTTQTFLIPAPQSPYHFQHHHPHDQDQQPPQPQPHYHHRHPLPHHHHHHQPPPLPPSGEGPPPGFECPMEQGPPGPPPPQPVPPPQMVPPPNPGQIPSSINLLTSIPPPPPAQVQPQQHHQNPHNAPWLYQAQPPGGPPGQIQVQTRIHYHARPLHLQNGHTPPQLHYAVQPPPGHQQPFEPQQSDSLERQKGQGLKRRFADVEGPQEAPPYQCGPPPAQRQGNGEGEERQQRLLHGPSLGGVGVAPPHGDRNKPLLPPPHPGEQRSMAQIPGGPGSGNDGNVIVERGPTGPLPAPGWQIPHGRIPWGRGMPQAPPPPPPLPMPPQGPQTENKGEGEHRMLYLAPPPPPPPTNVPPPRIIRPVRVFGRSVRRRS